MYAPEMAMPLALRNRGHTLRALVGDNGRGWYAEADVFAMLMPSADVKRVSTRILARQDLRYAILLRLPHGVPDVHRLYSAYAVADTLTSASTKLARTRREDMLRWGRREEILRWFLDVAVPAVARAKAIDHERFLHDTLDKAQRALTH